MGVLTEVTKQLEKIEVSQSKPDFKLEQSERYKIFIGMKVNKSIHRVKGKNLVEFANAIGLMHPKYINAPEVDGKKDYSKIQAFSTYPNTFTIDAAFDVTNFKFPSTEENPEGELLIPIPSKILHVGQSYDYSKAQITIKHGQKLYTTGYCEDIYAKKNRLWITIHLNTRTKEGLLVVQSKVNFIVREGGFIL